MNTLQQVLTALRRIRFRVDAMVTRAVVELVNDSLKTQRLQLTILADEVVDDVEHFQPYGLSFVPPAGSEAIALAPSGSRANTLAICVQHPDERPKGKDPRTGGLYTRGQWRLFIDEDGAVHLAAEKGAAKLVRDDRNDAEIKRIWDTLTGWTPVAQDGGAAFLAAAKAAVGAVQKTGADKVHGT